MPSKISFVLLSASKKLLNGGVLNKPGLISVGRHFSASSCKEMRFVQFKPKSGGPQRLGAQVSADGDIFDISAVDSSIPSSLVKCLQTGHGVIEKTRRIIAAGQSVVSLQDVHLLSPITKPDKIVCIARNYSGHCEEQNAPKPTEPTFFSKFPSCIVGPYDDIVLPPVTNSVDWEVELAVVIGETAKAIRPDQVHKHIFGYTIAQDISARDWQKERNGGQYLLGKSMDTFCPLGPSVVTRDQIVDVNDLNLKTIVNGVQKQSGNTSELIFKIDFIVSYLSQIFTLCPGDVILTGTPAGVGMSRNPPQYLKAGDVVESEIEHMGKMCNKVV
ncbi:hypothetical protein RN001_011562 [Aquatica leii]|uniref:Fumarylacetoacetase-like C-terminal domain-containing protein n=1 Tax=Aquatica leii TaxID=1421715 RepID=A0AAN7NXI4_9COLE|nr:hypothetical protein RN001_011562 [Aquatica leii]